MWSLISSALASQNVSFTSAGKWPGLYWTKDRHAGFLQVGVETSNFWNSPAISRRTRRFHPGTDSVQHDLSGVGWRANQDSPRRQDYSFDYHVVLSVQGNQVPIPRPSVLFDGETRRAALKPQQTNSALVKAF